MAVPPVVREVDPLFMPNPEDVKELATRMEEGNPLAIERARVAGLRTDFAGGGAPWASIAWDTLQHEHRKGVTIPSRAQVEADVKAELGPLMVALRAQYQGLSDVADCDVLASYFVVAAFDLIQCGDKASVVAFERVVREQLATRIKRGFDDSAMNAGAFARRCQVFPLYETISLVREGFTMGLSQDDIVLLMTAHYQPRYLPSAPPCTPTQLVERVALVFKEESRAPWVVDREEYTREEPDGCTGVYPVKVEGSTLMRRIWKRA